MDVSSVVTGASSVSMKSFGLLLRRNRFSHASHRRPGHGLKPIQFAFTLRRKVVQYIWPDERINPVSIAGYRGFGSLSNDNYLWTITRLLHVGIPIGRRNVHEGSGNDYHQGESTVKLKIFPGNGFFGSIV